MNVLPWLLNWPPRRASVAVFFLLTAFSVGTLFVFGGVTDEIRTDNVTVESTDLTVRLNDELAIPDTNGTVRTCTASGTPGDHFSVTGTVTVDSPSDRGADGGLTLVVTLAHTAERTTHSLDGGRAETERIVWLADDDETLSVGDTATVDVRVRGDGRALARTRVPVPVENASRSYAC